MDTFDGLVYAGSSVTLKVRNLEAARLGLSAEDIARTVNAVMLGETATSVIQGDRLVDIRVTVCS